jgi:hypothetical protein
MADWGAVACTCTTYDVMGTPPASSGGAHTASAVDDVMFTSARGCRGATGTLAGAVRTGVDRMENGPVPLAVTTADRKKWMVEAARLVTVTVCPDGDTETTVVATVAKPDRPGARCRV